MSSKSVVGCLLGCLLFLFLSSEAKAVNVIRNGDFQNGLNDWVNIEAMPPHAGGSLALITNGGARTILYQNLNVMCIAGKTFSLSASLGQMYYQAGSTVAFYLTYIDTINTLHRVKVLNPPNSSIAWGFPLTPTTVSADYTFPSDARKLVRLDLSYENSAFDGELYNIALLADSVTVGGIPTISGISPDGVVYGSTITISGSNFTSSPAACPGEDARSGSARGLVSIDGANLLSEQGILSVGGTSAGLTITGWTDSEIHVLVQDPSPGGTVAIMSDYVGSDLDKSVDISSPNYTVDVLNNNQTIIKGQTAEFIVAVDFKKGFTAPSGLSFSIDGNPALLGLGYFTPVPLMNSGGVALKIDTSSLPAGVYQASVKVTGGGLQPRLASFTFEVVTVTDILFREWQDSDWVYITSKDMTSQGELVFFYYDVVLSNQLTVPGESLAFESTNSDVLGVYSRPLGYAFYALDSGSADIVATSPDGFSKHFTVNVNLSDPKITFIGLSPDNIFNVFPDIIYFSAIGTGALSQIGVESSGVPSFSQDITDGANVTWSNNNKSASSMGHVYGPTDLGTVLFFASIGTSKRVTPFTITSGPSMGEVKGGTRILDDGFIWQGTLNFYSTTGDKLFSRDLGQGTLQNFDLGGFTPGTYKLMMDSNMGQQWYPNTNNINGAAQVTFQAGVAVNDIYFFMKKPQLNLTKAGSGAGSIVSDPEGLNCGVACTGSSWFFDTGTTVTLTAAVDVNSTFSGWTGCTVDAIDPLKCSVQMDGEKTVTVEFTSTLPQHALTVNKVVSGNSGGRVTSNPAGIDCGSACTRSFNSGAQVALSATPDANSTFTGWIGCTVDPADPLYCTAQVNGPMTITATFAPVTSYTVSGLVTSGNGGITCDSPVKSGSPSNCLLTPATGWYASALTDNDIDRLISLSGNTYAIASVMQDHTVSVTYGEYPVRRDSSSTLQYYNDIQTAYSASALSDETIKALAVSVDGGLTCNLPITVTLMGGYDPNSGFGSRSGLTSINNQIIVGQGTVIFDGIAVTSNP